MGSSARSSRQPPAIVLVPVIIAGVALFIGAVSSIVPLALAGQFYLLVPAFLAFRYWPPLIRWAGAMPVPHRFVFGLLLASLILGHLTLRPRTWFPFIPWAIFPLVREEDPVLCPQFIATTASGQRVRLLTEQLYPSIVQIYPLDDPTHFSPDTLRHLAHSLARAYNRTHAADPVRRVDLMRVAVHLHPSARVTSAQPSCELLKHYDLSSAPSN